MKQTKLYSPPVGEIIGQDKSGRLVIGTRYATDEEMRTIRENAKQMASSVLWPMVIETATEVARRGIFDNTKSWEEVQYYKAMMHVITLQKNLVATLANVSISNTQPVEAPKRKRAA